MPAYLKHIIYAFVFLSSLTAPAQEKAEKKEKIKVVYGGVYNEDNQKYPGATVLTKKERQVQFEHEGVDLWCDVAVLYPGDNLLKAFGNVFLQQGDTLQMNSGYLEYSGNSKLAMAEKEVVLQNPDMTLTTDKLYFDRNTQEAYYNTSGTVKDSTNVLTSKEGRYYLTPKKFRFVNDVTVTNPDYTLHSLRLDYYTTTKHAYMFGPSTIIGKDYTIYCERGFYKTQSEEGYFVKNSRVEYNDRIINGDSLYFNKPDNFASATNNIKITDTINKGIVKGHYAEVFKEKDSVFITRRAVAVNQIENDSIYIHGDTLMVTGEPENRIIRAYYNARFYKTDMSGKCDSIHSNQKTGITQLIRRPILWSGETQMTGDSINLLSNPETEQLDSLRVWDNAFVIQKDTLIKNGYNQIKGKELLGYFEENELRVVDIIKNAESVYYTRNDKQELIGIDKHVSGNIQFTLAQNEIQDISYFINPDAVLYPETELPENARKLRGFVWYGDEMIRTKEDIFDEDDNNIELVKIRGIDNPIDIEEEEEEYRRTIMDSVPQRLPPRKAPPQTSGQGKRDSIPPSTVDTLAITGQNDKNTSDTGTTDTTGIDTTTVNTFIRDSTGIHIPDTTATDTLPAVPVPADSTGIPRKTDSITPGKKPVPLPPDRQSGEAADPEEESQ